MNEEYYLNQGNCKLPKMSEYLIKNNYLSEYNNEFVKQQVRDNLGITDLLNILKQIIDAKVIEVGGVNWDSQPTEGHTENILSSDALYKTFAKYVLSSEVDRLLYGLSSDYNKKIGDLQETLTLIPKNRGEYIEGESYYKGELVQYENGTYIANPEKYGLSYINEPPFNIDPEILNPGWEVFARNLLPEIPESVSNITWDDTSKAIIKIINGEVSNVVTAEQLKQEIGGAEVSYDESTETLYIN